MAERVAVLAKEVIGDARNVHGVSVMLLQGPRIPAVVKDVVFSIRKQLPADESYVLIGATRDMEKPLLTLLLSDSLVKQGLNAGKIVREAAKFIKGGGGGQPFFAQAGGKDPEGLSAAKDAIMNLLNLNEK